MDRVITYAEQVAKAVEIEAGPWKVTAYAEDDSVISGSVLMDGDVVGNFTRVLVGGEIHHLSLGLNTPAQGKGFASMWIAHCKVAYCALGVSHIVVHAQASGSVIWHRMGFQINEVEWHRLLGEIASQRRAQRKAGQIDEAAFAQWKMHLKALRCQRPDLGALERIEWNEGMGEGSALQNLAWRGQMVVPTDEAAKAA